MRETIHADDDGSVRSLSEIKEQVRIVQRYQSDMTMVYGVAAFPLTPYKISLHIALRGDPRFRPIPVALTPASTLPRTAAILRRFMMVTSGAHPSLALPPRDRDVHFGDHIAREIVNRQTARSAS